MTCRVRILFCIACAVLLFAVAPARAALSSSDVLILVNRDYPISSQVAAMYQKLRSVPPENIFKLSMGSDRNLTPDAYWQKVGEPLKRYLGTHPSIRCILTTSGVPYTIQTAGQGGIAFDNELAAVLQNDSANSKHAQPNPLFMGGRNLLGITDPRRFRMVYVSRLDGPALPVLTRMVEDAIATEQSGLTGPVYGDAQGIDSNAGYGVGDFSIRAAIDRLSGAGFKASLDMKQESWKQPKAGVGTQATGAAFYMGWYDLLSFQNIFGIQGLARGSIAWHIASQEAQNIWDPNGGWCAGLMAHGAAVTLGPVSEPYVAAFPHGDIFTERLLTGDTVAESYWLSLPQISWAMVLLGDPLYRPFASKPRPSLIARAYVADNATHILHAGETSPLWVGIECIGPEKSSTPPLLAKPVADFGLASASGPISIPALKAGEGVVVRVPSVTAGADPTGMFRLHLEVQDGSPNPRNIVLEGRIGFSRLTTGLGTKTLLSPSPSGDVVASGIVGGIAVIETSSLRAHTINGAGPLVSSGLEFSPDGSHIALGLLEPEQKQVSVAFLDKDFHLVERLSPETRFLRWLSFDTILVKTATNLEARKIGTAESHTIDIPQGAAANVIAGTDIAIIRETNGTVAYRKGNEPAHAVLPGSMISDSFAAANDLSLFGGVDAEKKLWIQRGIDGKPQVIASGVEHVLWGPISKRVLVHTADNKDRVYDGGDESWTDLGSVAAATWSPDEQRLLFVQKESDEQYLSLLSGRTITRICDLRRIGSIAKMDLTNRKDYAFLLSGIPGRTNAWIVALPSPDRGTQTQ